jgi:hypothetical protein
MNRKLIAAVGATAVVALSACGSSTDDKPAAKITTARSSSAPATSGQTVEAEGAVDGQALASKMVDAMIASKTAHTTLIVNGASSGEGDYEFSSPLKVSMKMSQQGLNMEIVQVGGVTFIKGIPGMAKPWLKFDPKGTDTFSKLMSSLVDVSKSNDPRALVSVMEGVKGRDVGSEQMDGVPTEHYAFEVPLSAYGRVLSPEVLKLMQGMVKGPIAMGYWVDAGNLPRKLSSVMEISGKKQSTEITYSDWGKPVNIAAPPAAQVGKLPGQ